MRTGVSPGDLPTIEAALRKDGIWVSPGLAGRLTKADLTRISKAEKASGHQAYVVVADVDYDDPDFPGGMETLLDTVQNDLGKDGVYIGAGPHYDGEYETTAKAYPDDFDVTDAVFPAMDQAPKNLAQQIVITLQWVRKGGAADYVSQQNAARSTSGSTGSTSTPPDDGSGGSGVSAGVWGGLTGAVIVLAAAAAGLALWRRRRPTQTGFRPSRRVLANVRAAEDRTWAQRAQADVLALGETIDGTDMPADPTDAWQAALDHYAAARGLVDAPGHPTADDIGAIVLAARGSAALAAAQRGRGWTPKPTCYFNPLHGSASRTVEWTGGDTSVEVPACAACGRAVTRGAEPDDILDLVEDGRPRHYFQLDVHPWSETGYGALDTDLLGRLLRR